MNLFEDAKLETANFVRQECSLLISKSRAKTSAHDIMGELDLPLEQIYYT